jgi:hypothetical protein
MVDFLRLIVYFRVEKSETNSIVEEQPGIFQLIDQLENAVDKILERQVPVVFFYRPLLKPPIFLNLGHYSDMPCSFLHLKNIIVIAEKCFLCDLGPRTRLSYFKF